MPLEVAKEYCSPKFSTPEDVLKAGQFMVATQLARDPLVRSCMRDYIL
uniref:Transcription elongation factor spt6 n=1 Tax=Triatoma infestans TaxID=30076 RepID=A0A170UQW7_TRIIF